MLILVVWLILTILFSALVLAINYWIELFSRQDLASKKELTDATAILRFAGNSLFPKKRIGASVIAAGIALCFPWLFTLLGGLVAPDVGPEPDFASSELANYFFQSILTIVMIHVGISASKDLVTMEPFSSILSAQTAILFFASVGLLSIHVAIWGVYHSTFFLFSFINGGTLLTYAALVLRKAIQKQKEENIDPQDEGSQTVNVTESDSIDLDIPSSQDEDDNIPIGDY